MKVLTAKEIHKSYKSKQSCKKAIRLLKDKKILPLNTSPKLSRIIGHLIGDGNLSKDVFVGDFRFYGSKHKLIRIRKDIKDIFNIKPKQFYSRKGGFVLKYNNSVIARSLNIIGVPRGNKVEQSFRVPLWIRKGNSKIKRAFLVAICDDELSSPRIDKRGYVEALRLKFNKEEEFIKEGMQFMEDIRDMLSNFGVKCSNIKINNSKYISRNNGVNRSIYFNISSKRGNLINFADKVGFYNEKEKQDKLLNILTHH